MPLHASCRASSAPRCRCSEGDRPRPGREAHQPPGFKPDESLGLARCSSEVGRKQAVLQLWMSRGELVRLVDEAEADSVIRRSLRHCRSQDELILAARRLGYRITRVDLQQAQREDQKERRIQALDAQCINVPITEAMAEQVDVEQIVNAPEQL